MTTYYFFKLLTSDYGLRDSHSLKLDKMIALMEHKLTNNQRKHANDCVFEGTIPAESNGALARLIQQRQETR